MEPMDLLHLVPRYLGKDGTTRMFGLWFGFQIENRWKKRRLWAFAVTGGLVTIAAGLPAVLRLCVRRSVFELSYSACSVCSRRSAKMSPTTPIASRPKAILALCFLLS